MVVSVVAEVFLGSTTEVTPKVAGIGSSLLTHEVQLPLESTVKQFGGFLIQILEPLLIVYSYSSDWHVVSYDVHLGS